MNNEPLVFRKIKILNNCNFIEAEMSDLKSGDCFQMFEPDGTAIHQEGQYFQATSQVYLNADGIYEVECVSINET